MLVFKDQKSLTEHLNPFHLKRFKIGFVPTMGALHNGHLSLIQKATEENKVVVVSIFVNPTQFNNVEDLEKYPRTLELDLNFIASQFKKTIIYTPETSDIYGSRLCSESFNFNGLESQMEGKFRPGHFDGVGTVVHKFFEIIKPHQAYFGEKDFQQLQIIKKLAHLKKLPIHIVPCPIIREKNGLAMSSRNERLQPEIRKEAAIIFETLQKVKKNFDTSSLVEIKKIVTDTFEQSTKFSLEYFEIAEEDTLIPANEKQPHKNYRAFIAVFVDNVRLIDTISLK
jgi:pantoate--beta-alanine ligase